MESMPEDAEVVLYESRDSSEIQTTYPFETYKFKLDLHGRHIKGIHVIRNPYEVIVSAYNYHKYDKSVVNQSWLDSIDEKLDNKSYRDCLFSENGLIFEMNNISRKTIMGMYSWDYEYNRFLNIKLEDFYNEFEKTIMKIAEHLGFDCDVLLDAARDSDIRKKISYYATNTTGKKYRYPDYFKKEHFDYFSTIFPADTFKKLGYV